MKSYIFLDIDGTISSSIHKIEDAVAQYLCDLSSEGYLLVFVTGRSYFWAKKALSFLPTPFILAVQNGAMISSMPEETVIKKSFIAKDLLKIVDRLIPKKASYVIYTGIENHFRCYYIPDNISAAERELLLERSKATHETWIALNSFEELPVDTFPAIKFFGEASSLKSIANTLQKSLNIFIPVIIDPVLKGRFVAQGTLTNKGTVVDIIKTLYGQRKVIAAGDEMNDLEMLQKADIKLVIETAPQEILQIADLICSAEKGLIEGLKKCLNTFE